MYPNAGALQGCQSRIPRTFQLRNRGRPDARKDFQLANWNCDKERGKGFIPDGLHFFVLIRRQTGELFSLLISSPSRTGHQLEDFIAPFLFGSSAKENVENPPEHHE